MVVGQGKLRLGPANNTSKVSPLHRLLSQRILNIGIVWDQTRFCPVFLSRKRFQAGINDISATVGQGGLGWSPPTTHYRIPSYHPHSQNPSQCHRMNYIRLCPVFFLGKTTGPRWYKRRIWGVGCLKRPPESLSLPLNRCKKAAGSDPRRPEKATRLSTAPNSRPPSPLFRSVSPSRSPWVLT